MGSYSHDGIDGNGGNGDEDQGDEHFGAAHTENGTQKAADKPGNDKRQEGPLRQAVRKRHIWNLILKMTHLVHAES